MLGLHIISDLKNINFSNISLSERLLQDFFSSIIKKYGLTEVGHAYYSFSNENEITGIIALAESHISIHTWPEKKYISLDIFVCNMGENNSQKARYIYQEIIDFFDATDVSTQYIERQSK